jgi:hypothetical protein
MLSKQGIADPHQYKKPKGDPIGPWQQLNDFHVWILTKEKGQHL